MRQEVEVLEKLGAGAFGTVFRGRFRGSDVAVKTIHMAKLGLEASTIGSVGGGGSSGLAGGGSMVFSDIATRVTGSSGGSGGGMTLIHEELVHTPRSTQRLNSHRNDFKREMMLLLELRHPNCIMLMGAFTKGSDWVIVTEFMRGGSLADALVLNPTALEPMKVKLTIILDTAKGLSYLHNHSPPILHCDLKPGNLLLEDLSKGIHCKIADFGLSKGVGADGSGERYVASYPPSAVPLPVCGATDMTGDCDGCSRERESDGYGDVRCPRGLGERRCHDRL